MKVTYTQNRFEIDGVEIINPKVMNLDFEEQYESAHYLKDGDSFSLPENIIAEKVTQVLNIHNEWVESIYEFDVVGPAIKEVYHLKLKEPLVDTGSKDKPLREHFEVETDAGDALRVFDYIDALEKYVVWLEHSQKEAYEDGYDAAFAMEAYSSLKLSEYKQKLKAEIEKQMIPFTSVTINDAIRNDYRREVLTLIDKI